MLLSFISMLGILKIQYYCAHFGESFKDFGNNWITCEVVDG